ncbi:MAG: PIG-L deacetylase family protein [Actinomycetota bacterium]
MGGLGTILGVWAHPDDDIYLSSGLMAVGAAAGDRVVDVTATRGEGGSMDEGRWPPERMAEVRTAEMRRSLDILGVQEHRFLEGLVDVDMQTSLDASGAAQVLEVVREVQPDTMLTFGPDGMTGHEAHKDVSRWAAEAFAEAAKPGARLFTATVTARWAEIWLPRLEPFDIFLPGTPTIVPPDELAIEYALPDDVLDLKFRAIQAHESQVEGLVEVFGDHMRDWMAAEYFRLAASKEP